jgi:hypothetical protein
MKSEESEITSMIPITEKPSQLLDSNANAYDRRHVREKRMTSVSVVLKLRCQ